MTIVTHISRVLLGIIFTVFGLNGFLHFIPQPPMAPGLTLDFFMVMIHSQYLMLPFALQVVAGVLFLINRYIPIALSLIGPVIVNILMFHILLQPAGIPPGLIAAILWCVVMYNVRSSFAGIFTPRGTN